MRLVDSELPAATPALLLQPDAPSAQPSLHDPARTSAHLCN